ncbi:MAG: AzlD domain-containing protein [Lentisphaeria bacterium]|nr:AzlD domain-containing protein [Lentisphaeria bacterium]MBO7152465.1 AzlD domain-containing protein [Lentisphaeria bacterium]
MSNEVIVHALLMVAVMSVVTHLLRAFPFIVFGITGKAPKIAVYLGKALSPAAIAMLVVYCFKSVDFCVPGKFLPELGASAVVIALHIWRRNPMISICAGTLLYMLLIRL